MRLLVSAGPTREFFDSVRFISNPSTGKMGYAIAAAAARRGHQVTLVSGPVALRPPAKVKLVRVVTAAEMAAACRKAFRTAQAAVMTAAVCDYRPVTRAARKIPKFTRRSSILLEPTEDIARSLGQSKGKRLLMGFAMEDANDPHALAVRKLVKKHCDLIVLNGPENVGSDTAVVQLYGRHEGWSRPMRGSKRAIARLLVEVLEARVDKPARRKTRRPAGSTRILSRK